ncbi:MAG: ribulokinase [Bacteroidia bacterium]|nr:ribulokinase [Bacteroidia bacterium]
MSLPSYLIGLDYGTDSVRAILSRSDNGEILATEVFYYPRWAKGMYCDAPNNQFRQHPQDYLDGLTHTITSVLSGLSPAQRSMVKGIAVDTTGSTPVAVDPQGTPLALLPEFAEHPNAMFVLWKDHTAIKEAEEINQYAATIQPNYLQYVGGIYSSEWFWAKILHVSREDEAVRQAAYSWVEHCDWIPYVLCGGNDVKHMKRSRCAAGHKGLWHPDWDGLPPEEFWVGLDPVLAGLRQRLYSDTYTSDIAAGHLSEEWANSLGLSTDVVIAVGAFDAHMGAVGGEIRPFTFSRIMGTSTCDILIAPNEEYGNTLVKGICGQVDGSVVPGMLGLEAGQSAFGDIYAWFRGVVAWPLNLLPDDLENRESLIRQVTDAIIPALSEAAAAIPIEDSTELALDWMNGRRTPDADQSLKGALLNLNLGSGAPRVFRALVEATCFGSRAIVDRFRREGIPIHEIVGLGGVAKKSPFVMQTLSNVLNMPLKVARAEQTCALGAAMFAATAADIYPDVLAAQAAMGHGFEKEYHPQPEMVALYARRYERYMAAAEVVESFTVR